MAVTSSHSRANRLTPDSKCGCVRHPTRTHKRTEPHEENHVWRYACSLQVPLFMAPRFQSANQRIVIPDREYCGKWIALPDSECRQPSLASWQLRVLSDRPGAAKPATPPAPPWIRIVSPRCSFSVSSIALKAVRPVSASAAALSWGRSLDFLATIAVLMAIFSA